MLNHKTIIEPEALFFGTPEIQQYLPKDKINELLDRELYEWVSSVYWGEKLGIEYAHKMYEISPTPELKDIWWETYREELDHQKRIVDWLLLNGTAPSGPTLLMKRVQKLLDKNRKANCYEQYREVIQKGQIFLEETGAILIKKRTPHIKDRTLKAIFYKIYRDEMPHISQGKKTLLEIDGNIATKKENYINNIKTLFPLHVAKEILSSEELSLLKSRLNEVLTKQAEDVLSVPAYQPPALLPIFEEVEDYQCFGCKPSRSEGLLLEPKIKSENSVFDEIVFSKFFTGMNSLVHGGFISMALDEMMGYAITLCHQKFSLTTKLEINFKLPVKCGETYRIEGQIESIEGKKVKCTGKIIEISSGNLCATSTADFYLINSKLCNSLFPGILANSKTSSMVIHEST
jgi:acyl-coenzyme A thioesterase PaaI-like protein